MLAEIVCFAAFCLWTLTVYLVGKYLGQQESYKAGMSAGWSECLDSQAVLSADSRRSSFEQIAGLWPGSKPEESEHRDCIRPEAK